MTACGPRDTCQPPQPTDGCGVPTQYPTFPDPCELRFIEEMGAEAIQGQLVVVHLFLLQVLKRYDPLYQESDTLDATSGEETQATDKVGEGGGNYLGPIQIRALVKFHEEQSGGEDATEEGRVESHTAQVYIPRGELRRLKMIDCPNEELAFRQPNVDDIVGLWPTASELGWADNYDRWGVGPWYFAIEGADHGRQIGTTNYFTELILDCTLTSRFDPGRSIGVEKLQKLFPPEGG